MPTTSSTRSRSSSPACARRGRRPRARHDPLHRPCRSTERAGALGDRAWAELLEHHHRSCAASSRGYGGEEIDTAGDGFLALFDGPPGRFGAPLAIRDGLASSASTSAPVFTPARSSDRAARGRAASRCTWRTDRCGGRRRRRPRLGHDPRPHRRIGSRVRGARRSRAERDRRTTALCGSGVNHAVTASAAARARATPERFPFSANSASAAW